MNGEEQGEGEKRIFSSHPAQFDYRKMASCLKKADDETKPYAGFSLDRDLRGSTRGSPRPLWPRLVSRLFRGRPEAEVNFLRCFSTQSLMRAKAVVPRNVKGELRLHVFEAKGDKDFSCVFVLQRENRSLDDGDASVLSNGSESRTDLHATAPVLEGLAEEYRMLV